MVQFVMKEGYTNMKTIAVFLYTSPRKNARAIWHNNHSEGFNLNHICDFLDFITRHKDTHSNIEIIAYDNDYIIRDGRKQIYSIEQIINTLWSMMRYLNLHDMEYTLSELYCTSSIKYYINRYYHS